MRFATLHCSSVQRVWSVLTFLLPFCVKTKRKCPPHRRSYAINQIAIPVTSIATVLLIPIPEPEAHYSRHERECSRHTSLCVIPATKTPCWQITSRAFHFLQSLYNQRLDSITVKSLILTLVTEILKRLRDILITRLTLIIPAGVQLQRDQSFEVHHRYKVIYIF